MDENLTLPHVVDVVTLIVDSLFHDGMRVIQTAQNIHDYLLVPYPLSSSASIFAFYPPLRAIALTNTLMLTPEVEIYLYQLPAVSESTLHRDDILFPYRARLIRAYQRALIRRTDYMSQTHTRIDAPFLPMTPRQYEERVAYVVERAITIPIDQSVDWWADVTCGVAQTSPSPSALTKISAEYPDALRTYRHINSWRAIGNIIELLER